MSNSPEIPQLVTRAGTAFGERTCVQRGTHINPRAHSEPQAPTRFSQDCTSGTQPPPRLINVLLAAIY